MDKARPDARAVTEFPAFFAGENKGLGVRPVRFPNHSGLYCDRERSPLIAPDGTEKEMLLKQLPDPNPAAPRLTAEDFDQAAADLGVESAVIRAVAQVESGGRSGFDAAGRPKILFEAHLFDRLTRGRFRAAHPNLSQPNRTAAARYYADDQWARMNQAWELDPDAAVQSASWGMFQVLGSNYACGWTTLDGFVSAMFESERQHLRAFLAFCRANRLIEWMKARNWPAFARAYNGPAYRVNRYDELLDDAYRHWKKAA